MHHVTLAQWFVSENICALCDSERHLAHVIRVRDLWFVFDATHLNGEEEGCLLLGTFARKLTAMEAAESELLNHPHSLTYSGEIIPASKRFRAQIAVLPDTDHAMKVVSRRA